MHSAAKIVRVKIKAHTAESRKAADQRKSREALRKDMVFRARQPWRSVALARTLLPNRSAHLQTDGRPRINRQGYDSQPVPESAVAAAFRRRDVRTDDGAHQLRGSRRSARFLALGRGVTLACPSVSRGVYGSDDSSPRSFGDGDIDWLH